MAKQSTNFRKMLTSGELHTAVLVGTAHHAQLAQKAGFKIIGISGAMTSAYLLGLPDAGYLTLTDMVQNTQRICRATDLPVFVDCDTGYGNAINVRRTVESIIWAGAAGLFLEDQVAPKRCGFVKGKQIISLEEAVGKYRAAVDARDELDSDFVIIARCDARGAVGGSLEEVIRRGKAYLEAGVDVFYAEALQSREEVKAVREALPDSLLIITDMFIAPQLTEQEYQELGICMDYFFPTACGSISTYDYMLDFQERGQQAVAEYKERSKGHPLGGFGIFDLTGFGKVAEWEEKYLNPEKIEGYDQSLGMYDPRVGHPGGLRD